eukprot:SAG11_NODE_34348_length_272_cov_0.982659_1_plen_54_part_01
MAEQRPLTGAEARALEADAAAIQRQRAQLDAIATRQSRRFNALLLTYNIAGRFL